MFVLGILWTDSLAIRTFLCTTQMESYCFIFYANVCSLKSVYGREK